MGEDKALLKFNGFSSLSYYQYNRLKPYFKNIYLSSKVNKFDFPCEIILDKGMREEFESEGRSFYGMSKYIYFVEDIAEFEPMMSAGCIRARYCSGSTGHHCPVGLATQDKSKRRKYFVYKHANYVRDYHKNLLKSIKGLLAVMGIKNINNLDKHKLIFLDRNSKVHDNIDDVFGRILDIGKDPEDSHELR